MPEHTLHGDGLTRVEMITLAAVSERPRYGYELVQRMAELTDGQLAIRPGNLYRVLHRLEARGLVVELPARGGGEDARRRYFGATVAGRRAAAAELALYAGVLRRIPSLREEAAGG